jgi:osmotically-inducible protein OsmY
LKRVTLALALAATLVGAVSIAKAQNPTAELTRKIRKAVVDDSSLSVLAHNIKIISANGNVTLRGTVKTQSEKAAIANKAQTIAGADKVDNQLEVEGQQ